MAFPPYRGSASAPQPRQPRHPRLVVLARRRNWTARETARAALQAGVWSRVLDARDRRARLDRRCRGVAALRASRRHDRKHGAGRSGCLDCTLILERSALRCQCTSARSDSPAPSRARGARSQREVASGAASDLRLFPDVRGIPAFFAAARYGTALLVAMSLVFAGGTIATYVTLSVAALLGLGRVGMGRFERYGEVLSGGFIAFVGLVFAADNGPLSQIQN